MFLVSEWPEKVREVGCKSILHDEAGTSGTEMVRKMTFFSGTVAEERWAHRTRGKVSTQAYFGIQDIDVAMRHIDLPSGVCVVAIFMPE